MKKFQRFFSFLICIALVMGIFSSSALAASPAETNNNQISEENVQSLGNVPIYIDFTSSLTRSSEPSVLQSIQIETDEQSLLFEHDLFAQTMEKAQSIINSGGTVKAVHFLLPEPQQSNQMTLSAVLASNNWTDYTYPLRSYNGYQFRYVDSYIDGETGYIEVKDIGKVKWKDVIETGLKAVIPSILGGTAGTALSIGITLNDLISAAKVNPVMTYTYGAESYIKYNAVFRHYLRNIYINDKDNIIPGYDYYICGSSERAEIDSHVQSRWPTDSYSWVSSSGKVGLRQGITTPGFYGPVSVVPKFIQSYQLQRNYYESIALKRELIAFMLRFEPLPF